MLLITRVETMEVDRDTWQLQHLGDRESASEDVRMVPTGPQSIRTEVIMGRRFRRPSDGRDIVIGFSENASDALGLSFDVFEAQERRYNVLNRRSVAQHRELNSRYARIESQLIDVLGAPWWRRLMWVFTGARASPGRSPAAAARELVQGALRADEERGARE